MTSIMVGNITARARLADRLVSVSSLLAVSDFSSWYDSAL